MSEGENVNPWDHLEAPWTLEKFQQLALIGRMIREEFFEFHALGASKALSNDFILKFEVKRCVFVTGKVDLDPRKSIDLLAVRNLSLFGKWTDDIPF